MKRKLLFLSFALLICVSASAQREVYKTVKVSIASASDMRLLGSAGIDVTHGDYRPGVWFISDFSAHELEKIGKTGLKYEVIHEDAGEFYRNRIANPLLFPSQKIQSAGCGSPIPSYSVPVNFTLGTYGGGYLFYQEMLDNLDSMAALYPSLITIKQPIDTTLTIEGRPVFYMKISDNPQTDETEPEVLYTAIHHAREPESMSQLIFYMWYLLENYSTSTEIQYIIDNTEMFFVPCLNPDGYIYNEVNDPGGGGMWRKNRRDNLDGTFGVDPNRNYGYNWGYDDNGSSPDGFDETYRGSGPFSEPETQAISSFCNGRQFLLTLNYHTYGNLFIYPWGYEPALYTPDSAYFVNYAQLLTRYNNYKYGTADQTVNYVVNGSSDDWMYGEQTTKPKILSCTPEVGDGQWGFWPPPSEIIPLAQGTVWQNMHAAFCAGKFGELTDASPSELSQTTGHLQYNLKQMGLDTSGTFTVTLTGLMNVISTGAANSHSSLALLQVVNDSISFTLDANIQNGDTVVFVLSLDNGAGLIRFDTIQKIFGQPSVVFSHNGNNLTGWVNQNWGNTTSIFVSAPASITDSPFGDYNSNEDNRIRLQNPVSLTNAVSAKLAFFARWEIENTYDYAQVEASSDGGITWTPLCGKYTKTGSTSQDPGQPVYDGAQYSWVQEEMSLDNYIGSNILIRFKMISDGWTEYDGFYFDDFTIEKILPSPSGMNESMASTLFISQSIPNPAQGYTWINFNSQKTNSKLKITDFLGREAMSIILQPGQSAVKLNVSSLSRGVYFYWMENDGERSGVKRMIVD